MDMQLLNLIIQPLLGGAAGYITNEYAINMLFKAYTPLKLGGVIPKTRDAFIENISNLVEQDILNKEKIESILNDKSFIKNFDNLIEDFFSKSLYEVSDNLQLKSIPCMSNAVDEIQKFAANQIALEVPNITRLLSQEIKLDQILDNKQIHYAANGIFDYINNLSKNSDVIDNILHNLIDSNKELSLKDALGEDIVKIISQNICDNFCDIKDFQKKHEADIDILINGVMQRTNIYNTLCYFIENLIFTNREALLELTKTNIDNIIKSDNFYNASFEFSNSIIEYGKSINITLFDLVNDNFINKVKNLIIEKAPYLSDIIIKFAKDNNLELKKMIEEAVDETINEQDAAKKALLGMAKGSILSSITKNDVASTLENILQNKDNIENISLLITVKIKQLLKNTTISDLVCMLEEKNLLTAHKLNSFMINYISINANNLVEKLFDSLPIIFKSKIVSEIIKTKVSKTIKEKIFSSDNFVSLIRENIASYVSHFSEIKLNEFTESINLEQINAKGYINNILESNKGKIIDSISKNFHNYVKGKSIRAILNETTIENINNAAISQIDNKVNKLMSKVSELDIYELINNINEIEGIEKSTSEALRNLVLKNLDVLLHSFIKGLSVNNLSKLDDEKLCEMAKSFMGNNLRPIMLFGGMLGVIAGIILAIIQPNANVLAPISVSSAITYSLVGYMTNAIAINMLFRPYNEIKPIKNIPFLRHFSLGYIAKNKAVLADSMSYAINEYLLTKDSMDELIDANKENIKLSIVENLSKNNYELLTNTLINNKNTIINALKKHTVTLINSNQDNISNALIDEIDKLSINKFIVSYKYKFSEYIKSSEKKYNEVIKIGLNKLISNKYPVTSIIPQSILNDTKELMLKGIDNNFDLYISKINYSNTKNLALKYDNYYKKIQNKSLLELIPTINLENIVSIATANIKNIGLTNKLIDGINRALNSDTAVGELLGGEIAKLSNNALNGFYDNTADNSKALLSLLKPSVSKAAQDKVTSNLNFLVRGAYNMIDGNKIVDSAVEKIMLIKLPQLIASKKDNLHLDTVNMLNNNLLNIKLSELELNLNSNIVEAIINNLIEPENTDKIRSLVCNLIEAIKKDSSKLTIGDFFKAMSIDNIDLAFDNYRAEITELLTELKTMLEINKNDLYTMIHSIISNYYDNKTSDISINNLFKGINNNDLNVLANNIKNIINDDTFIDNSIDLIIEAINKSDNNISVFDFVNKNDLNQFIKNTVRNIVTNNNARKLLDDMLNNVFDNTAMEGFNSINNKAKDYFINIVTEASILSLRNNLSTILNDIEFDTIAKEQINAMKPKKIHAMFNSFAGKYFRKLMIYGFGGAVFGINIIAGIALAGAYGIKNITKKEP